MSIRIRKEDSGYYRTVDVLDGDGRPYTIERCAWGNADTGVNSDRPLWAVVDSRGREVSQHPTFRDAKESLA